MKKTNFIEEVSYLGLGAMRFPMNEKGIDFDQVNQMVDISLEKGINYFDTAFVYGDSELAIRECLVKRHPRESYKLADKLSIWVPKKKEELQSFFDSQLERCGVSYFDYYLMHAIDNQKMSMIDNFEAFEFMKSLKERGLVKHIGFSFHDTPELLEEILINHPEMEFIQLQINYLDWKTIRSDECYKIAVKYNKPIIIMEPVKGGTLATMPTNVEKILKDASPDKSIVSWAFRFFDELDNIMCVLSGMSDKNQLLENIEIFDTITPFTDAEHKALDEGLVELSKISSIPCTGCKYCIECPKDINIPAIFGIYNQYKRFPENAWNSGMAYRTNITVKADECIECGKCESHCPQFIKIIDELKVCHKTLS